MAERSLSPSPNKSQNLERGVFSSISSISLYKSMIEERKQSNSLLNIKSPKPKSPIRSRLMPSPRLVNRSKSPEIKSARAEEENPLKQQQDVIKKLQQQLFREKKSNESLEEQLKTLTQKSKAEASATEKNMERLQKALISSKSALAAVTAEKETLVESLKKAGNQSSLLAEELKILASLMAAEIPAAYKQINEEFKEKMLKGLKSAMARTKVDLSQAINDVEHWKSEVVEVKDEIEFSVEYFDREEGADSLASTRGFKNNFLDEIQNAVALYDFDKERDEDLEFSRGDVIEILEKNDSGWWIGRIGDLIGTFPFNFVNII